MIVRVDTGARTLNADGRTIPCAIGRSGAIAAADKREGDGATPLGSWLVRALLLRPDRVAPPATALPWRWLRPDDGWSDDIGDPAYNRPVSHPHRWSAERMWRDDALYDAVVVLGHNDAPVIPGAGSAIFLHCWCNAAPTEGCVAVERAELLTLAGRMVAGDEVAIV